MGNFFDNWNKIYGSKVAKTARNFLLGKDMDLSDEEYREKYGYNKPIQTFVPGVTRGMEEAKVLDNITKAIISRSQKPVQTAAINKGLLSTAQAISEPEITAVALKHFNASNAARTWGEFSPAYVDWFKNFRFGSFKQGGVLKGQNGLMVHPRMILNLRKLIPAKILKNVANVAHNLQSGHEGVYPKRNVDGDPGNTFLLDTERQKEELKNLGYIEGREGDYGLVKNAVNNLIKDTHKSKIPIYQLGNDEAIRDTLHVIYNGIYPKNDIPEEGKLIHAGTYPFAIYKGNNSNTYFVKSWDLNDYGKHGDSEGTTYGSRQFLADLYDQIGSPFVQTSGFKQIKDWDGKVVNEESLDFSDETFSETPHIKEQIKNITNLENEFGKEWAVQAINNIRTLYNNDLLTNGVIPIKPNVK